MISTYLHPSLFILDNTFPVNINIWVLQPWRFVTWAVSLNCSLSVSHNKWWYIHILGPVLCGLPVCLYFVVFFKLVYLLYNWLCNYLFKIILYNISQLCHWRAYESGGGFGMYGLRHWDLPLWQVNLQNRNNSNCSTHMHRVDSTVTIQLHLISSSQD